MSATQQFLTPSEAARRLGVSAKALRLYEARGLINPARSEAGWRHYGHDQMARAGEIVALRGLGLSLGQIERVLGGDPRSVEPALAAHQSRLEGQGRQIAAAIEGVAGCGRRSPRARCRPRARWRACGSPPDYLPSASSCPGLGAASRSS